jgi:hypothetical protein
MWKLCKIGLNKYKFLNKYVGISSQDVFKPPLPKFVSEEFALSTISYYFKLL